MTSDNGKYGNQLDNFPVEPGTIWNAGRHRFLCYDVCEALHKGFLGQLIPATVDCVYTDPPWTESIQRAFYKYAGQEFTMSFDAFLIDLVLTIKMVCPTGVIFMDMGKEKYPLLMDLFEVDDQVTCENGQPPL